MGGVSANGPGRAAGACEVQSVPSGPASEVGSCPAIAAPLQSSGRSVYVRFKANESKSVPRDAHCLCFRWFSEGSEENTCIWLGFYDESS